MIQEMKHPLVNQSAKFQRSVTYSATPCLYTTLMSFQRRQIYNKFKKRFLETEITAEIAENWVEVSKFHETIVTHKQNTVSNINLFWDNARLWKEAGQSKN